MVGRWSLLLLVGWFDWSIIITCGGDGENDGESGHSVQQKK